MADALHRCEECLHRGVVDLIDAAGGDGALGTGVCVYRLEAGGTADTGRMVLLK